MEVQQEELVVVVEHESQDTVLVCWIRGGCCYFTQDNIVIRFSIGLQRSGWKQDRETSFLNWFCGFLHSSFKALAGMGMVPPVMQHPQ